MYEIGKTALIVFLCLLTLAIIAWMLYANDRVVGNQTDGVHKYGIAFVFVAWLGSCVVGSIASVLMMIYASF